MTALLAALCLVLAGTAHAGHRIKRGCNLVDTSACMDGHTSLETGA